MSLSAVGEIGDLDCDAEVGFGDFGVMALDWGAGGAVSVGGEEPPHFRAGAKPWIGDLDRDGVVGLSDLAVFAEGWASE